jgi:uncharacterized protein YeaO (DUF488 family)
MKIELQRSYDIIGKAKSSPRFLIDRLWPRGLKKEELQLDAWVKNLAPSDDLRKWYHLQISGEEKTAGAWNEFRKRYFKELDEKKSELDSFLSLIEKYKKITLIYSSKEREANNATVLQEYLLKLLK